MLRLRSAKETAEATKLLLLLEFSPTTSRRPSLAAGENSSSNKLSLLLEFSPTTFRRSSRQQNKWQENENFFAKPVTFYLSQDT